MSVVRRLFLFFFVTTFIASGSAQWTIENSNVTANLRGIHNVGAGVAWAVGTEGTILRTTDDGRTWKHCPVPPNAERLDFQGIQAFDENTAVIMSSGPGDQSRIYKTSNGCLIWVLLFTNPDAPNGSFKAIAFQTASGQNQGRIGTLIGDPVKGKFFSYHFSMFSTYDYGKTWRSFNGPWKASARHGEVLFAASNSSLIMVRNWPLFVTAGAYSRSRIVQEFVKHDPSIRVGYVGGDLPIQHGKSAGAGSIAAHLGPNNPPDSDSKFIFRAVQPGDVLVAVGGDSQHPENSAGTCAVSIDGSLHWSAPKTPPHGYRSAVAYDETTKTWITIGPNGTDISTDDGLNWHALKPKNGEPAGTDKNWNALSLPFVVGPDGRIGKLRADALK